MWFDLKPLDEETLHDLQEIEMLRATARRKEAWSTPLP
jgi:hypothetical protein